MENRVHINPDKLCVVEFSREDRWIRLALRLTNKFAGGELVHPSHDAVISVAGSDELSALYNSANWLSGVVSGALFAFRALSIPRQRVEITEFAGRLRASDMEVVANAAATAIAKLAEMELPNLDAQDWIIKAQVSERALPIAAPSPPPAIQTELVKLDRNNAPTG